MANKRSYRFNSIGDVSHCLKKTINELKRGDIQIGEARARGYLLNILLDAMRESEIEQKLVALEERLAEKMQGLNVSLTDAVACGIIGKDGSQDDC